MMYFKNRSSAGELLAQKLDRYVDDSVVVLALTDGAIIVGESIAKHLRGYLTLLLSRDITIPGEIEALGTVDQSGGFTYNNMFSAGQIEEFVSEYHNFIEAEKMNKSFELNHLLGQSGLLDRSALQDRVLILVSDGVRNGTAFDAALNYLKPVRIKRLIAVTPVSSVPGVDRMHIIADEIHVLNVADNFISTGHYYEDDSLPSHEELMNRLTDVPKTVAETPKRHYN